MRFLLFVSLLALVVSTPPALGDEPTLPAAEMSVSSQAAAGPLQLGRTVVTLEAYPTDSPIVRLEIWDAPADVLPVQLAMCEAWITDTPTCTYRETVSEGTQLETAQRFLVGYAYDLDGDRAEVRLEYARADVGAFRTLMG